MICRLCLFFFVAVCCLCLFVSLVVLLKCICFRVLGFWGLGFRVYDLGFRV
jgi:hypothetical protein